MGQALHAIDAQIQRRLRGDPLKRRTGNLGKSITQEVKDGGAGVIEGRIGPTMIYGRIHEMGGLVSPVRRKYLAIPLDAAKTKAGVARGGPLDYADTFVAKTRSGKLLIMQRQGKGAVPLFALVSQVRIPARPYLAPSARAAMPRVTEILGDAYMASVESHA